MSSCSCSWSASSSLWRLDWFPLRPSTSQGAAKRPTLQRLLKPRSPDDCPACRLVSIVSSVGEPASAPVRPWSEVKSRRGAPKRIDTAGFACPNPLCQYFGSTDAHHHALVGDGKHGRAEPIQTFRCQACRTTFTSRRNTPLYRLKTPSQQVAVVLSALAEGLDPSAAERVFGFRQMTITTWLTRAGSHAQTLHGRTYCHLWLPHLQLDELRTRLRCAALNRCCGSGWPSIPSRRSSPCFSSVLAPKPWPIGSFTRCDRCWPLAAFRSSPVMV